MNWESIANTATGGILGIALGDINDQRQLRQQGKLQELQIQGAKELGKFNYEQQLAMWNATNLGAQVEHAKKAGLNPALLYGKGGATGQLGATAGMPQGGSAPAGGREVLDVIEKGIQMQLLKAQKENIEADTAQKQANVPNIEADTANKVLQQVINEYAGKEAKETFEMIMAPNRRIQAKTYEDELAARQGVAGTIYELWIDGKLAEKSLSEIEAIANQNAKTRAETRNIQKQLDILEENLKGAKLENIIKELETKLQTQTGIDRNSPTWIKILGRLFVGLLNK